MVARIPLHARHAAEILQRAQIGDPYEVLANACEGGILKGYAGSTGIIYPNGRDEVVLRRRIPPADWRCVVAEGKVADIANATVRLSGSPDFDGDPRVTMIDIGFHERAVREYANRHGVQTSATAVSAPPSVSAPAACEGDDEARRCRATGCCTRAGSRQRAAVIRSASTGK